MDYFKELFSIIEKQKPNKDKLNTIKIRLCKKHGLKKIPTDIEISLRASSSFRMRHKDILSIKPSRESSGVSVVAIMTKPLPCPHGKCDICPGGPNSEFGTVPQSYTGKEPATRRAIRNRYDAYLQVFNRLEQYIAMSKFPDKVELIIMGGTFPSYPSSYQNNFVLNAFKAMNDFSSLFFTKKGKFSLDKYKEFFEMPGDLYDKNREKRIKEKMLRLKSKKTVLSKEHSKNEKAVIRCVGLTIETRPDYATLKHAKQMLKLGCTRVELGVQTIFDDVLKKISRGHSVKDSIIATGILKDLGFKINYHMMPGLPGMDKKMELFTYFELFTSEHFQPDMLKIYPCMVLKGTKLYQRWKKKKFKPLTTKKAVSLICEIKQLVPHYVRIMRVQRDIPTHMTEAGVDKTNLRQYIDSEMKKKGLKCECIRCREVKTGKDIKKFDIQSNHYLASAGNEFFIEANTDEKEKKLLGFCRLRFPNHFLIKEIEPDSALIRELHVYGPAVQLGKKGKTKSGKVQHTGIGKKLMEKAEEIARKYFKKKMVVISAVGTRGYYRKLGYKLQGSYMVKKL
jgi:elongator complex protein 3